MRQVKDEIKLWSKSRRRVIHLLIGVGTVMMYEILRAYYRPFIYTQGINDLHLADTLGNSLGTVAAVFVFISLLGRDQTQERFILRTVVISVLLYELAHPLLGKTIDIWDLIATVAAGIFCEVLYRFIHRPPKNRPAYPSF